MKRKKLNVFSLSFLDIITCGLGAIILLFVLINAKSAAHQDTVTSDFRAEVSRLESGEWVQEALEELTDQMRSVVTLVYYQGMKYREAADVLRIPVGTVKSRLHSAIQKLNEHWNNTHTR